MIIKSMTIHSFGKLHDRSFNFEEGLNVVYGLNEQGKSTIHKFIEVMFYGFYKAYTKNRQYEEAYESYLPWDHSGYGGTLTFEDQGRLIRMERQMTKGKEKLRLFDVSLGVDITDTYDYNKVIRMVDPGMKHFGHNKITYQNTVSMTQMSSKTDGAMITEIKDHMSNLASSHQTEISVEKVMDQIHKMENTIGSNRKKTSPYFKLTQEIKALNEALEVSKRTHLKIAQEKQLENHLLEKQNHLSLQIGSLKKDLAYIESVKAKSLLMKVEEIEEEEGKVEGALIENLPFKTFDLKSAEDLRVQTQLISHKHQQILGLEDKVKDLLKEKTKLEASIEETTDVRRLAKVYEDLDVDVTQYRTYVQQLTTKKSEHEAIQQQVRRLPEAKAPNHPLISGGLAGILIITGLWLGIQVNNLLFGMVVIGSAIGVLGQKYHKVQQDHYENDQGNLYRLKSQLEGSQKDQMVLMEQMHDLLTRHEVSQLEALECKRDQALKDKFIGESQMKAVEKGYVTLALMVSDIEGLSAQVKEQKQLYEEAKSLQAKAFKQIGIKSEDEIDQATKGFLAYRSGVETLKHLGERKSDLLADKSFEELKVMLTMAPRQVTIHEEEEKIKAIELLRQEELRLSTEMSVTVTKQMSLAAGSKSVVEIEELLAHKKERLSQYDHELAVADLMKTTIETIAVDIQNNFAPVLNKAMSQVVKTVTGGKYSDIKVNPEMRLTIYDEDAHRTIAAESLSAGTIDILYFGLRLGISEVLSKGKALPLILDDTFVQYDDERMSQVVQMLSNQKRQVLLFTCHKREMDVLNLWKRQYHQVRI